MKPTISPRLQEWAKKHNQVVKVDHKGQVKFEDVIPPIDWQPIIAYGVLALGIIFTAFLLWG